MSSSESSYNSDTRPRKKRRRGAKLKQIKIKDNNCHHEKKTNFICNACGANFQFRSLLLRHLPGCERSANKNPKNKCKEPARTVTCGWCNLTFRNRGNLATHAYHLHGDSSYRMAASIESKSSFNCNICQHAFRHNFQLTYHIRRIHFNLKAKIPQTEVKEINQVWFEKVLNSDNLIEIKKTGQNTLVMRKLEENSSIKINNDNTDVIDLSHVYPTRRQRNPMEPEKEKVQCEICKKMYVKRDYKKHVEEIHYNMKKHHCNNCNRSFKRSYHFLKHVCSKIRKLRGVHQFDKNLRIASVESLSKPFR